MHNVRRAPRIAIALAAAAAFTLFSPSGARAMGPSQDGLAKAIIGSRLAGLECRPCHQGDPNAKANDSPHEKAGICPKPANGKGENCCIECHNPAAPRSNPGAPKKR